MHKLMVLIMVLSATEFTAGQEIKSEVANPAGVSDSKPNSDAVPDTCTIVDRFERVMVVRMKYKTDLLCGLRNAIETNNIRNAVILAGIGSVKSYHYHTVSDTAFPTTNIFVRNNSAPADIVSMNGYVVDGRVHAHITLSNDDRAFGGHLESGTSVFTFAIVTLGIPGDNSDLRGVDDKSLR